MQDKGSVTQNLILLLLSCPVFATPLICISGRPNPHSPGLKETSQPLDVLSTLKSSMINPPGVAASLPGVTRKEKD